MWLNYNNEFKLKPNFLISQNVKLFSSKNDENGDDVPKVPEEKKLKKARKLKVVEQNTEQE